jgi:erythromycin esterase
MVKQFFCFLISLILFVFTILFPLPVYCQNNFQASVDTCIISANTDNNIFDESFFDKSFKALNIDNKRIVMLGEQSHGDEISFKVKSQIIKYLITHKGFNVLAFETGYYDMLYLDSLLKKNQIDDPAIRNNLQKWWSASPELLKLFTDLQTLNNQGYDVNLRGIDCQFTGNYSINFLMNNLIDELSALDTLLISNHEISQIIKQTKKFVSDYAYRIENPLLKEALVNIKDKLLELSKRNNFKMQPYINSFDFYVRRGTDFGNRIKNQIKNERIPFSFFSDANSGYFIRDSLMSLNVIELLKNPKNKIIIWAHNAHIIYNMNALDYNESLKIRGKFLGNHLHDCFPDYCLNVGFTSYSGITLDIDPRPVNGFSGNPSYKQINDYSLPQYQDIATSPNSIEDYLNRSGTNYCFYVTRCRSGESVIFKPTNYVECRGELAKSFDALFFIKTMVNSVEYFNRFSSTNY